MKKILTVIGILLAAGFVQADQAPLETLTDHHVHKHKVFAKHQQAELIFIDALCPMPHFPGCEAFIESLAKTYKAGQHNSYLVFNTLYVDSDTIADFVKTNHLNLPVIIDTEMDLHRRFSIHATPYQITLSPQGEVTYRGPKLHLSQE